MNSKENFRSNDGIDQKTKVYGSGRRLFTMKGGVFVFEALFHKMSRKDFL